VPGAGIKCSPKGEYGVSIDNNFFLILQKEWSKKRTNRRKVYLLVFVGTGFCPRTSSPEGLSHMRMEQEADREGGFLLFSVLNSGKSFLPMHDVLFFVQEAIEAIEVQQCKGHPNEFFRLDSRLHR
jgi:hypothetical protein